MTTSSAVFGLLLCAIGFAQASAPGASAQPAPRLKASDIDTITLHRPAQRFAYGTDSLQFGELRLPEGRGPFPVAILIHGGCYLSKYATVRNSAALADALASAGVATWNVEYRRYDHPGGGWPGTFADVAAGADYLRILSKQQPLDLGRVIVMGHSAGGQLALWLGAQAKHPTASPLFREAPIKVIGVVALGPITDMREYQTRELKSCGNPAIESVLGGLPDAVPDRVRMVSPIELLPLRVPTVLVAGEQDGIAPTSALNAYASAARLKGDRVQIFASPNEGHFDALAPSRLAGKTAIAQALALLGVR
ncbi:MAG: alpha/beta hydrolase [Gemmatimonadaceae bacterium]